MKASQSWKLLAALPLAAAQTYPGFLVDIQPELNVIYGNISITNGQQLPRPDVASPPNISSPGHMSSTGRAVLIMMDSDVPANSTSRVNLLHWLAPDITGTTNGTNSSLLALPPSTDGVPYLQPSPPQGDYPHRYSFLLYEQPRNFTIPAGINASNRVGFNLEGFLSAAGLSTPLAANYMLVANTSGPATTSYPPALYTASSTLASSVAGATTSVVIATETASGTAGSTGASGSSGTSASATGSAASATATSQGEAVRIGSGIALVAALFGMMMM